jgi:hypothetical protein
MYVFMYNTYVCTYVCMLVSYVSMCARVYDHALFVSAHDTESTSFLAGSILRVNVCMHVCVYVCIYIHI